MIESDDDFEKAYKIINEKNISFSVLKFITSKFQEDQQDRYLNLGFSKDVIKLWVDNSFVHTRYGFRAYLDHWLLENEVADFIDYLSNLNLEDPSFKSEMILRTLER
jgi:hypothetical protein